jgi:tripeptidyl-peptidase-2
LLLLLLQVLSRKLDSPVSVPVYSSHAAALTAGSAAGECFLAAGDRAMLWLGPVPEDKLPKDAQGEGCVVVLVCY